MTIGLVLLLIWFLFVPIPAGGDFSIRERTVDELITQYASVYEVSEHNMHLIINCESQYYPEIQSKHINSKGEREQSFGLVQIHLPAENRWQGEIITEEQSKDPEFAIRFLAHEMSIGNTWKWTCAKDLAII